MIDDRKQMTVGNKSLESLVIKQKFCERELNCLLTLFQEANTLTDLISKLQEFDIRQIQFQKASQLTADTLKNYYRIQLGEKKENIFKLLAMSILIIQEKDFIYYRSN